MNEREKAEADLAKEEQFDAVFAERALETQHRRHRNSMIKHSVFWTLGVLYVYLFIEYGNKDLFVTLEDVTGRPASLGSSMTGSNGIGGTLVLFLAAICCLWYPAREPDRVLMLRSFGWFVYLMPLVLFVIYHFLRWMLL